MIETSKALRRTGPGTVAVVVYDEMEREKYRMVAIDAYIVETEQVVGLL